MKRPGRSWVAAILAGCGWAAGATWSRGAEEAAPATVQVRRKGQMVLVQPLRRPALIERLAKTVEPEELPARDVFVLEAYLAANSGPRRAARDGFYSDEFAVRGTAYDDPVNRTLGAVSTLNHDEWQRLRMHLLFNRMLVAERAPQPAKAP